MQTEPSLKEITTEELRTLLAAIKEELEERGWHKTVASPRVINQIVELVRQAREERAAGHAEEGDVDVKD